MPVLIDDELHVWDSLAIVEYLNEKVQGRAWPSDSAARAHARSVSAEMHSGFAALRQTWSMRALGTNPDVPLTPAAASDVARIDELWNECRRQYGAQGPWLFGEYSIADAMYAPVVLRFNHYGADALGDRRRVYASDRCRIRTCSSGSQKRLRKPPAARDSSASTAILKISLRSRPAFQSVAV